MPYQPQLVADKVMAEIPVELRAALKDGATLLVSVSGGADSDAMSTVLGYLHQQERWPGTLVLLHAHLGRSDWPQTLPHVQRLSQRLNFPLHVTQRAKGDLLAHMWQRLQSLQAQDKPLLYPPSSRARYCTSDNKRGPLDTLSRKLVPHGQAVSAIGIRAAESKSRSEKNAFSVRHTLTTKTRTVYDWLPLFNFSREEVWTAVGTTSEYLAHLRTQVSQMRPPHTPEEIIDWVLTTDWPCHVAYPLGQSRLSCVLCMLARHTDLEVGAHFNPALYRDYVSLEVFSGGITFQADQALHAIRPDLLTTDQRSALGYEDTDTPNGYQIALL